MAGPLFPNQKPIAVLDLPSTGQAQLVSVTSEGRGYKKLEDAETHAREIAGTGVDAVLVEDANDKEGRTWVYEVPELTTLGGRNYDLDADVRGHLAPLALPKGVSLRGFMASYRANGDGAAGASERVLLDPAANRQQSEQIRYLTQTLVDSGVEEAKVRQLRYGVSSELLATIRRPLLVSTTGNEGARHELLLRIDAAVAKLQHTRPGKLSFDEFVALEPPSASPAQRPAASNEATTVGMASSSAPAAKPAEPLPRDRQSSSGLGDRALDSTVAALDATVTTAAASFSSGLASAGSALFNTLDQWVRVLEKRTGGIVDRGGLFEKLARDLKATAAEYAEQGFKPSDGTIAALGHYLYGGMGQAAFDLPVIAAMKLPTFSAMTAGAQAAQAGENVALGTAVGLAHGLMLLGVLKATGFFRLPERLAVSGLIFSGTTLYDELQKPADQRDYEKVVANFLIGTVLASKQPGGRTPAQLLEDVRNAYGPQIEDAANQVKALAESPGYSEAADKVVAQRSGANGLGVDGPTPQLTEGTDEVPAEEEVGAPGSEAPPEGLAAAPQLSALARGALEVLKGVEGTAQRQEMVENVARSAVARGGPAVDAASFWSTAKSAAAAAGPVSAQEQGRLLASVDDGLAVVDAYIELGRAVNDDGRVAQALALNKSIDECESRPVYKKLTDEAFAAMRTKFTAAVRDWAEQLGNKLTFEHIHGTIAETIDSFNFLLGDPILGVLNKFPPRTGLRVFHAPAEVTTYLARGGRICLSEVNTSSRLGGTIQKADVAEKYVLTFPGVPPIPLVATDGGYALDFSRPPQ